MTIVHFYNISLLFDFYFGNLTEISINSIVNFNNLGKYSLVITYDFNASYHRMSTNV